MISTTAFRRLLERLVRSQARAASTTIATPSGASRWLLERVATRCGIDSELHMTFGMLLIVRRCIAFDTHTQTTLAKLLNRKRSALLLTLRGDERAQLADAVRVLVANEREYVASFRTCFPDNLPKGSLAALLEASMRCMALERALATNATSVENPRDAMREYIGGAAQRSAEVEHERCLMEVEQIMVTCEPDALIPGSERASRLLLLADLLEARQIDTHAYKRDFEYCDIDKVYARVFQAAGLARLVDELRLLQPAALGMYVFPLASKWHRFFNGLRGVDAKLPAPDLAAPFRPFVLNWISVNTEKLISWAQKACQIDRWEPFDANVSTSSSVVDVFQSCAELINVLSRHDYLTKTSAALGDVIVAKTIRAYADELLRIECAASVAAPATLDDVARFRAANWRLAALPPQPQSHALQPQSCVRLNNLDAARSMLVDLEQQMNADAIFDDTLAYVKATLNSALACMLYGNARFVQPFIMRLLRSSAAPSVDALFAYLDAQLSITCDAFIDTLFTTYLQRLWDVCMASIELALVADAPTLSATAPADRAEQLLHPLQKFLHADGIGLKKAFFQKSPSYTRVASLILFMQSETAALDDAHATSDEADERIALIMSARAKHQKDAAAKAWLKRTKQ